MGLQGAGESWFEVSGGVSLFERTWPTAQAPRAALVILHGYGHHSGCFDAFARYLNGRAFAVHGFDQRGHGRSPGRRCHVASFEQTLDDTDRFVERVRGRLPGVPLFILGHSLGALILGHHAVTRQPETRGLIFASGLLNVPGTVSPLLLGLADLLATVVPWLRIQKVDYHAVSRDPAAIEDMLADPLRDLLRMDARTGAQILHALRAFEESMDQIAAPMLVLHGTADRLTDIEGSRTLFERARSADKTMTLFEGGYHELYNDLEKDRFMGDVCRWMEERC